MRQEMEAYGGFPKVLAPFFLQKKIIRGKRWLITLSAWVIW